MLTRVSAILHTHMATNQRQVKAMCELEGAALRAFGYDPATQNFPQVWHAYTSAQVTEASKCVHEMMPTHVPRPYQRVFVLSCLVMQAMLSLPPYERCVKFLDKAAAPPSPPPAAAVPPAASTPEPGLPPAAGTVVNKGAYFRRVSSCLFALRSHPPTPSIHRPAAAPAVRQVGPQHHQVPALAHGGRPPAAAHRAKIGVG